MGRLWGHRLSSQDPLRSWRVNLRSVPVPHPSTQFPSSRGVFPPSPLCKWSRDPSEFTTVHPGQVRRRSRLVSGGSVVNVVWGRSMVPLLDLSLGPNPRKKGCTGSLKKRHSESKEWTFHPFCPNRNFPKNTPPGTILLTSSGTIYELPTRKYSGVRSASRTLPPSLFEHLGAITVRK